MTYEVWHIKYCMMYILSMWYLYVKGTRGQRVIGIWGHRHMAYGICTDINLYLCLYIATYVH